MCCEKMYLVISRWDLVLQNYKFLRFQIINAKAFTYQQNYQHTNWLILLFLQTIIFQMK
jgi:hypothetical protein